MVDNISAPSSGGALEVAESGTISLAAASSGNTSNNTVATSITDESVPLLLQVSPQSGDLDSGATFRNGAAVLSNGDVSAYLEYQSGAWTVIAFLQGHSAVTLDWKVLK